MHIYLKAIWPSNVGKDTDKLSVAILFALLFKIFPKESNSVFPEQVSGANVNPRIMLVIWTTKQPRAAC